MGSRVLVAGASGSLGRLVVKRFAEQGRTVRTLTRSPLSKLQAGASESHVGDALKPDTLDGACDGVELVFSCLGASVSFESGGRLGFDQVDTPANLALLSEARRAGVKRFVYVSAFHLPQMRRVKYIDAHEQVVDALHQNGMDSVVIRPTGFFSAFAELLTLARKGPLPQLGAGLTKSNPIHEDDLAKVCVEACDGSDVSVEAGGPEVLTRAQINQLVADALGIPLTVRKMPVALMALASGPVGIFQPRLGEMLEFVAALSRYDVVAEVRGTQRLGEYLKERARDGFAAKGNAPQVS